MENLDFYYRMIDTAIAKLGVDPEACRGERKGQWTLTKGSAKVWLDLWHIEKEGRAYFQAMCPVLPVPTKNLEAFYRELLEINDKLFGVAFTIYKEWAWIKTIREVAGMDENEAFAMITRVGNYGDQYDDVLKQKYSDNPPPPPTGPGNASA